MIQIIYTFICRFVIYRFFAQPKNPLGWSRGDLILPYKCANSVSMITTEYLNDVATRRDAQNLSELKGIWREEELGLVMIILLPTTV